MTLNHNDDTWRPTPKDGGHATDAHQAGAISGSRSTDHPRRIVEGPLYSPRWASFFTVAAVATVCLALWNGFIFPHILVNRAEEQCKQEQELLSRQPGPSSACFRVLEIKSQYSLSKRVQGFVSFLPLPLWLFYLARRLRGRRALDALRADPRAPVLYLRSFGFDVIDDLQAQRSASTEEVALVSDLERIGPVLAIGRPGEKLAHLGAARMYVTDEDWQTIAQRLMASARLVVIRAGNTPGLRWELARARDELSAEKVVPAKFKGVAYTGLRESVREALKVVLPEICPKGFVTFDSVWQPRPAKPEIGIPNDEPARLIPRDLGRDVEQLTSADNTSAAVAPSLSKLLEQLEAEMTSPPPFRVSPVAWVAVGVWLVLLWRIPGERWSFGLESVLGLPHFVGTLVEGATAMLLAVGLAFIPYMRAPTRRLLSSFILCAVLALDGYWIVCRATPNEVKPTRPGVSHEALEIDPRDAEGYYNRGGAYFAKGEYNQAISDYNKALEINPRFAEAYNNRGEAYRRVIQHDQAMLDYNKALEVNPRYAVAYNNRGQAYFEKGKYNQAISDYNKALEINPGFAAAYYLRGFAYYCKGEYEESWQDINNAQNLGEKVDEKFLGDLRRASGRQK